MRRYLVVANQTLAGRHLIEEIRRRMGEGPCRFHIVVPATPPHEHMTWTEGEARAIAQDRLDQALFELRDLGAEVTGEVGAERPLDAILDAARRLEFDEIILSTLPAGVSRWLRNDLPHRAERLSGIPLTHLVAETEELL
ncbi:MAG: universal stress protein [Actinobacteria bacterium]|nr:universal stress protein [Actinomycetota bacterium]